jgi:hypothetical protein
MADIPTSVQAMESAPAITAAYAYILRHHSDNEWMFFTNWQTPIQILNLPSDIFTADDPQIFTPSQFAHGEIQTSATWEKRSVELYVPTTEPRLRRYFVTAAAVKISAFILRINTGKLLDETPINYTTDTAIVASGILGQLSFSGQIIAATITPEAFLSDQSVPRFSFQRTCNHVLGDAKTCKVNLASSTYTKTTTILELDRATKLVTVNLGTGISSDFFRGGKMIYQPTGETLSVLWSDKLGTGSKVRLALRTWNPALTVGEGVTVTAGCRRTTDDCHIKFNNSANFGGFPFVPNRNPTISGIR